MHFVDTWTPWVVFCMFLIIRLCWYTVAGVVITWWPPGALVSHNRGRQCAIKVVRHCSRHRRQPGSDWREIFTTHFVPSAVNRVEYVNCLVRWTPDTKSFEKSDALRHETNTQQHDLTLDTFRINPLYRYAVVWKWIYPIFIHPSLFFFSSRSLKTDRLSKMTYFVMSSY